jgi:hypothetical protein
VRQLQLYAVPTPGRGYTATATASDESWNHYAESLRRILADVVIHSRPALV